MHIAILGQFPFDLSRLGGVEVAIAYLLDAFAQAPDIQVDIITCKTEIAQPETRMIKGVRVHYLPRRNLGRLTWHLREVGLIRRLVDELQPDVIHAHSTGLYAGAALACPQPSVITVHGIVSREVALYRGLRLRARGQVDALYERWCLGRARNLIAISPYVHRELAGATPARWFDVENAVDDAFFRIGKGSEPGRILYAGAVIERKGLHVLAEAMASVRLAEPRAKVVIAGGMSGEPAYAASLQRMISERGLGDAFDFIGLQDQDHLVDEYRRCSAFVMPSFQETAPMAVQQAMAAGRPVVATAVGGVPDMIRQSETGLLVPPHDAMALAGALFTVLSVRPAAALLAAAARADAVQRFTPRKVAQRTRAVYEEVLRP